MQAPSIQDRLRSILPFLLLGSIFATAIVLAGSARLEPADFTFNNATEVATLDPARVTGTPEGRVIRCLFEGLTVKHPETLEPLPGMAESWTISDDGLVYTFNMRRGAQWSNGDPVTAHDFVFSWERFLHPMTAAEYAYQLWYVVGAKEYTTQVDDDGNPVNDFSTVGIKANSDYELQVTLQNPTPFFMDLMGFYPLFPVNRRNIEEAKERWPDDWEIKWLQPENIVTNGPFTVEYRRVNDRIRFRKSETYWDKDNVALETIDCLAIEAAGTALNMYITGEAHYLPNVPINIVRDLLPREDFNPAPFLGTYFYRVNTTKPPFNDKRVRRALALTIDRKAICEKITKAGQSPATALVPPGMPGYKTVSMGPPNVAEAKALLAEAGYGPDGSPFPSLEIHYNTLESHRDIAEVIADSWRVNLGIDAKLLNQEWKVYLDTQSTLGYDVSRSAWIGDYADPNTFLDMFVTGGENNKTGWGNEEYDLLIARAGTEFDPKVRMDILRQAEQILIDEMPILPIYYYSTQNIVAPRLGGFYENIQDEHFPKFWYWMDDKELAQKRSGQNQAVVQVKDVGPAQGKYAPAFNGPLTSSNQ
jgi:oligopeptide transport system substrate-binding protein